jgi:2,4-dienoyl-CoA reductase-like NADH-dependent reductase (Old Yellow Enzyme family)
MYARAQVRNVVEAPVIGVGGISEPEYADKLIKKGIVDLVAVGRALLKDPDYAKKANETLEKS